MLRTTPAQKLLYSDHAGRRPAAAPPPTPRDVYASTKSTDDASLDGSLLVANLILNSFPVELSPAELDLPCIEYATWEASTADVHQNYADYAIHRYSTRMPEQGISEPQPRIRVLLLSGPTMPVSTELVTCDTGSQPHLTNKLIEHSLARHLEERGMTIKHRRADTLALIYHDEQEYNFISFHTGISFKSRQPHRAEPSNFSLTVQWEVGATFSRSLLDHAMRQISTDLPVKYLPKQEPIEELMNFAGRYLGTVINTEHPKNALIFCKDHVRRLVPYEDLTLVASPQALRRYDLRSGTSHQQHRLHRRIQQLGMVLTRDGRRNESVLTDRLHEIIRTLSGDASDQLVLPLRSFARGTVRIRLAPQHLRTVR